MKQDELIPLIKNFGFVNITKQVSKGYYRRISEVTENVVVVNKFKFKQCYITFDGIDIYIAFNNPTYTLHSTDISIPEIHSLFYYLTIISNRKFAIKKDNPDICNIYKYFEDKSKYYESMSYRERKRYEQDMKEFNLIKEKYISGLIK